MSEGNDAVLFHLTAQAPLSGRLGNHIDRTPDDRLDAACKPVDHTEISKALADRVGFQSHQDIYIGGFPLISPRCGPDQ